MSKEGLVVTLEGSEITIVGHRQNQIVAGAPLFRERTLVDYRRTVIEPGGWPHAPGFAGPGFREACSPGFGAASLLAISICNTTLLDGRCTRVP